MSTPSAEQVIRSGANRVEREHGREAAVDALLDEAFRRSPLGHVQRAALERLGEDGLPIPRLMGVKAVSLALGIPDSNVVRDLSRQGVAPAVELDRGKLYRASDVERVAEQRRAQATAGGANDGH